MRKNEMKSIFDKQINRLIYLGYPKMAGIDEHEFTKYIISLKNEINETSLGKIRIKKGNMPFLVVIPATLVNIHIQMSLVRLGKKNGFTNFDFLNLSKINDINRTSLPYLIWNIDIDGLKNTLPHYCNEQLTEKNRRGLFTIEGIALIAQYPKILYNSCLDLSAEECSSESIPHLWLNNGHPWLSCHWIWNFAPNSEWMTPSCQSFNSKTLKY